ncbi:IS4 family transposase [Actinocrinis puniceicyclus]|uniref:IS4 family transposase n=1 Tax=Actinocrinis puniceicyclus TaxID=977794 RepID=A0A8J8BHQ6_9ACTN|nr:IS4 family transposase [Actinocrinis puniceicyclus]MBS2967074.1 IS4 family transposase [Actinocrinis puniceicyclus]
MSEKPGAAGDIAVDLGEERLLWLRDAALAGPAALLDRGADQAAGCGLLERLVAGADIEAALAAAGHRDERSRLLPGGATVRAVFGLCLFSGEGYDAVLSRMAPHLRGGTGLPGQVPSGSALSQARVRLGEAPLRACFQRRAAATARPGPVDTAFGMQVTAFDGTCLELARDDALTGEFGCPTGASGARARVVTLVACATRHVKAAAIGAYTDSEQRLVDQLADALERGTVNLADRNFFSMDRFVRFAATGAHLLWRVKNGRTCLPARITGRLPDGSALVRLRESGQMLARRRRQSADPQALPLPDTTARIIEFDVTATDERGRSKTSRIRLLTTLLDPEAYPAQALASLYAERWQVEISYLRLKKTLRGAGAVLRGRSPALVRQEIWAFLAVYNTLCDLAAEAAALDRVDTEEISFIAVLRLTRAGIDADRPCVRCGHREQHSREALTSAIARHPRNRVARRRTSPRTAAERRNGHTQKVHYTITIAESNLPKAD